MTPPARILIVEDERVVALDLARRLRQLGYTIAGLATSRTSSRPKAMASTPVASSSSFANWRTTSASQTTCVSLGCRTR
jgi:CheY-like chemotaxis protein